MPACLIPRMNVAVVDIEEQFESFVIKEKHGTKKVWLKNVERLK